MTSEDEMNKNTMNTIGYTVLSFGCVDRLRILFGSKPHVAIRASLDARALPDDFAMETILYVPRLTPRSSKNGGIVPVEQRQAGGTKG